MLGVDIDAEGFATLTIDMPGRSMNVIDWDFNEALDKAVTGLLCDPAVKGIIIASAKSSFVAGADLAIMHDFTAPDVTAASASRMIGRIGDTFRRLEQGGKPVVAAASGTALGGGLELMLASHYRIAADNPKARFGLPEVTLGLLPGAGGTQRLPRLIGIAKALPMLLEGTALDAAAAKAAGILDEVVPADQLIEAARSALRDGRVADSARWDQKGFKLPGDQPSSREAMDLFTMVNAGTLAATGGNYPAPKAILTCVFEGTRLPIEKGLKVERDLFGKLVTDAVAHRMIRTNFFARQKAAKQGLVPGDASDPVVESGRRAYVAEGLALLADGADPLVVDGVARAFGMARGPIEMAREEGRDLPQVAAGARLGVDDIRSRLLTIQAIDAARQQEALPDREADLIDLAAVAGWGFPAWLGGPLSYVESLGSGGFARQAADLAGRFGDRFKAPPGIGPR